MKVTVLYGGPSAEREISLKSGQAVIEALRQMGHEVLASDVAPTDLSGLDQPTEVVFPVLHGQFGESGELQEILEGRRLPFVGSGSQASRLGMNKVATKTAWLAAGLPTPQWMVFTRENDDRKALADMAYPCVVKAISSGSSIDVFICRTRGSAAIRVGQLLRRHGMAMVEQFIKGPEVTIGLLEEAPLAPIRIIPKREFFDFHDKYASNGAEHRLDTGLPPAVVDARDLARIDIMLDAGHKPYLLEINTIPGFTPRSLLPEAARHAGIEFGPLVDRLVRRAAARGAR